MKTVPKLLVATGAICVVCSFAVNRHNTKATEPKSMMVRLSEIAIHPEHLEEYKAILKEESAASVRLEPGVISIYPMQQAEDATQIRILEIYADKEAYQKHIQSPHFQKYKTTTLKMVKSLRLVDMKAMDAATMPLIFNKFKK